MNILLINPPAENTIIGNNPTIIDEERGYNPPLGLLYVASYAEKHTHHKIEILDTQVEEISSAQLPDIIRKKSPDIVGIQTMTFTLIDAINTARIVKEVDERIKVVLGGPHIHIYPIETISLNCKIKESEIDLVDYLVLDEGEKTFTELLKNWENKEKLSTIPGLVFKHNGKIVNTGFPMPIDNLDEIPFPARHLTPYKKYYSLLAKRRPVTTMFTSRGCPCRCIFCDRPHLGKIFRARSPKNVVDEMEECVNLGIREFLIYDDTFTIHRQRVIDICDEIIKRKLNIGWDIRARVNTVDKEMLYKMRKANCERIHYGVESGTEKILKVLKKGITIDEVKEAFRLTKSAGISILAYFMIGNPTETREDIMKTMEFAKELDPDFVHITITTPFPSTALYYEGLAKGILKKDFWKEFSTNPTKDFQPEYWEENLMKDELIDLNKQFYKDFYTRPSYIIRKLLKVRSIDEFKRKASAGLKVLRI